MTELAPDTGRLGRASVLPAFAGAGLALAKAWFFPLLGLGPVDSDRARAVWGG